MNKQEILLWCIVCFIILLFVLATFWFLKISYQYQSAIEKACDKLTYRYDSRSNCCLTDNIDRTTGSYGKYCFTDDEITNILYKA